MLNEEAGSEAAVIAALATASVVHDSHSEVPFVMVPNGYTLKDLEDLQDQPRRIRQKATLATVGSFIEYMNAHKLATSVIFASEKSRQLRAVIDYHIDTINPSWCTHEAGYTAELSREAKAWFEHDGKALSQLTFAEFLEDRIADVVEPTGASLLETALKLQIIQKAVVGSAIRLQSGEFQMNWSEENEKGTFELPEKIALGIPLFHGEKAFRLEARLRYRLSEGKVTFIYKILERERALEDAFGLIVSQVRAGVEDARIYFGSR